MLAASLVLAVSLGQPFGLVREGLAIGPIGRGGRTPIQVDPLMRQVVDGTLAPKDGGTIGDRRWTKVSCGADGWFRGGQMGGGYLAFSVQSPKHQVVLLQAAGNSATWVNGVARPGDPYSYGWLKQPIALEEGPNLILVSSRRGGVRVEFAPLAKDAFLNLGDLTAADIVAGEKQPVWCSLIVANGTESTQSSLVVRAQVEGADSTLTPVSTLLPLQCAKAPFLVKVPTSTKPGKLKVTLTLLQTEGRSRVTLDSASFELRVRAPRETVKRTFLSGIDGSVQYYAVRPALSDHPQALVLSLHGASVEASGQADAYSGKPWCSIVCPTNRRPYGFDWEDIGRLDAMEVLEIAKKTLHPAADQVYVSGHSMGGHGTWQMAVNFPGSFAALGPSAGWTTFFSYGGGVRYANPTPVEATLNRASNPSDTMALLPNLSDLGVYILHGDADDNVPVSEARKFADALKPFHHDWTLFEQPGAGHWWENSDEPGAECMDWPPMYDLFARRRIPGDDQRRTIDFSTFNPGINASLGWAQISQQQEALSLSRVQASCEPATARFKVTTTNVARLKLDIARSPSSPGRRVEVLIDDQKLHATPDAAGDIWLARKSGTWTVSVAPRSDEKNPVRNGGFKDVFKNRVIFVYGTRGTDQENRWSIAKARYDAEAFSYIGNGAPEIMSDVAYLTRPRDDRNVLVYGNQDMNSAWPKLLTSSELAARRGGIVLGRMKQDSEDLAFAFIRPKPGSTIASVAFLGGTGIEGLRLSERLPIFTSGAGFPDLLVIEPTALTDGTAGVLSAGFFGNDWSVAGGTFATSQPGP